ncbi:dUTP diphosphatase [Citroniella saccharovorans]|uniref:Deoxyuridine 5'-triphosphate nucleotidohydrolase n=1 Tax=Citroniella saccharovorans TaxID=2053367 RepID=A0AAW9MUD6_9FIRM|nr:dUTP diphosphatase [Citroniella saccharovorans]MEB3429625.1 dUTP diphosphatase [Citroniella saccharovorans]
MKINIVNKSNNPLPKYETSGASGLDLKAFISSDIIMKPLERKIIPTGLYISMPNGIEAQIRSRSGLSYKKGLTMANGIGTIDSDYRGELKVLLVNLSTEDQIIKNGDRIAQLVFCKIESAQLKEVEFLDDTKRSEGGFGHTGI